MSIQSYAWTFFDILAWCVTHDARLRRARLERRADTHPYQEIGGEG